MNSTVKWILAGVGVVIGLMVMCCIGGIVMVKHEVTQTLYPKPKHMPVAEAETMGDLLKKLEAKMARKAPDVLADLNPGISDAEIAQVEAKYRVTLTEDLRALYRWRNGRKPGAKDRGGDLVPGYVFHPVEEAMRMRDERAKELSGAEGMMLGFEKPWVGVMTDEFEEGFYYDPTRKPEEGAFMHAYTGGQSSFVFYPTPKNVVAALVKCYEDDKVKFEDGEYTEETSEYVMERLTEAGEDTDKYP